MWVNKWLMWIWLKPKLWPTLSPIADLFWIWNLAWAHVREDYRPWSSRSSSFAKYLWHGQQQLSWGFSLWSWLCSVEISPWKSAVFLVRKSTRSRLRISERPSCTHGISTGMASSRGLWTSRGIAFYRREHQHRRFSSRIGWGTIYTRSQLFRQITYNWPEPRPERFRCDRYPRRSKLLSTSPGWYPHKWGIPCELFVGRALEFTIWPRGSKCSFLGAGLVGRACRFWS